MSKTGGQSTVYTATDLNSEERVALKALAPLATPNARQKIALEIVKARGLSHSAIIPPREFGDHGSLTYLAFNYVDAAPLGEVLNHIHRHPQCDLPEAFQRRSQARDPVDRAEFLVVEEGETTRAESQSLPELLAKSTYRNWACQVSSRLANALAEAHGENVLHGDVTPRNILIGNDGQAYLIDLGLAGRLDDFKLSLTGALLGCPAYMSPEQFFDPKSVDGRSDVYSLGATLYEMLTLRPPVEAASLPELMDNLKAFSDTAGVVHKLDRAGAIREYRPSSSRQVQGRPI